MEKSERLYFDNEDPENIRDILEITWQPIYFQYNGKDYLIEYQGSGGYIIVEPYLFYEEGGCPKETKAAYPYHLQAKTPEEMFALAFLDGK